MDSSGHHTVLHSFKGSDGEQPYAGVTLDAAGNLYGTTSYGGTDYGGVIYKLDPTGQLTVLYNFMGDSPTGWWPIAGVIRDSAGNLYGTASQATANVPGVVYMLNPSGRYAVLHAFSGGSDGSYPESGLVRDSAGNLYGTTAGNASAGEPFNYGTVYKLDSAGNKTILYTFSGGADGGEPLYAGVVLDGAGNLYGTTIHGGNSNKGVVYEVSPTGQETVLYSFSGPDGANPYAGVIRESGALYGTTYIGGKFDGGVVFKLKP